jgi:hypothetical protein
MQLPAMLPGRECGACSVCCVEMEIDDPELSKPDYAPCAHLIAGGGCAIQDRKPRTCRNWFCGWRFLHLPDAMRPDRCGVMLAPELGNMPGFEKGGLRVVLVDGDRHGLLNGALLDLVARCVAGGVPIFLSYGNGRFAKRSLVNEPAQAAIAAGDQTALVDVLHGLLDAMAAAVNAEIAAALA